MEILELCNAFSELFTGGAHRVKIVEERISVVGKRSMKTIKEKKY